MDLLGKTYASKITSELMPYALNNTAKILSLSMKQNPNKFKKILEDASFPIFNNSTLTAPLFDTEDVELAMENVDGIEFNTKVKVTPNIEVRFIPNGHLLGAASILVTISYHGERPIYLYFSGDYSKKNIFLDVPEIPSDILNLPVNLVTESTYGNSSNSEIKETFNNNILQSIQNNETLIIPVFSLGRSQEILLKLRKLQDDNLLPKSIPIYFDGKLAIEYTTFYLTHKDYLKSDPNIKQFLPRNLNTITNYDERQKLLANRNTKIIITTSGMGSYGPAQLYLPYYISRPKCTIHFCGYTTPNTFGSKIKEVEKGELFEINGIMTKKQANVLSTNEFSGHAKKEDLLEFISSFNNLKSVLINHGEYDTKINFAKYLINTIKPKDTCILNSKNYIRVGAYGVIKNITAF